MNGVDCQRLDKFQVCSAMQRRKQCDGPVVASMLKVLLILKQDFVREIVAQGNVRNMVRTLAVLAAAEKRKQAKAESDASGAPTGKAPDILYISLAMR